MILTFPRLRLIYPQTFGISGKHSGTAVDAHSGTAVDAHSGTATDGHAIYQWYKLAFIMKL